MTKLRLADDLSLPLDVVTQTIAILAKRRAGKSYTMRRIAEQLFKASQQIVIVDPKGDQWGIRSTADGKAPGLPVIILGGERGDVPLEPSSGEVVAKLVVEERVSVLLDLSPFRKQEVATFMTAFLETLYRLKAREIYRTPMMLVIDEADAVAPQKPQKGEERMLGAAEDIVRRGGQRGIGCVLVTQRSAVLNKNVLTQAQVLVALRTIAPQDLAAMKAWIDVHGTLEQCQTLMASLPSLPTGDAWFWSPGWPTTDGIFKRVHVLPIETFDSGATPKPGVKPIEPKQPADVDLEVLRKQMAATIEKAKAEDPKELRRQIAQLQHFLQLAKQSKPEPSEPIVKEVPVLLTHDLKFLGALVQDMKQDNQQLMKLLDDLSGLIEKVVHQPRHDVSKPKRDIALADSSGHGIRVTNHSVGDPGRTAHISRPQQRILDSLMWLKGIGIQTADRVRAAMLADQSPRSSGYEKNISTLKTAGLIDYPTPGTVALTVAGEATANPPDVPVSNEELHRMIQRHISNPQWALLQVLIHYYPKSLSREELAAGANVSAVSSGYEKNVSTLRSLGFIDYPDKGHVAAQPVLFLE